MQYIKNNDMEFLGIGKGFILYVESKKDYTVQYTEQQIGKVG